MSRLPKDYTGQRFGKLVVIEMRDKNNQGNYTFLCQCDCGNFCFRSGGNLIQSKSCGCYRSTMISKDRKLKMCSKCKDEKHIDEFPLNKSRKDGHSKYCKECKLIMDARYRPRYKKYLAKYVKNKRQIDVGFRLVDNIRRRINYSLKTNDKSQKALRLLGCTIPTLKLWLEGSFYGDMTWKNYGSYWHIDHIKPCSLFDFTNSDHQSECFHYKNLQALTAFDNQSKGDSYDG